MSKKFGKSMNAGYYDEDFQLSSIEAKTYAPSCYSTHPHLALGKGVLLGGNCEYPIIDNASVYIALSGYGSRHGKKEPWEGETTQIDAEFPITDYQAPKDPKAFGKMINWVCNQLQIGKSVHVGCIGGHGRTGTVLTAVIATLWDRAIEEFDLQPAESKYGYMFKLDDQKLLVERKFIQWVRKNYCTKAVESKEQVTFLQEHYAVANAEAAKPRYEGYGYGSKSAVIHDVLKEDVDGSISSVPGNRLIW